MNIKNNICDKCGEIHDVEKAGGHDLIQAETIMRCEYNDYPDDEFFKDYYENEVITEKDTYKNSFQ